MKKNQALDTLSSLEIVRIINKEDKKVAAAVEKALPRIAQAIDVIADALGKGGRLIYVGAGTSGRLAALDAAECPPTFNSSPKAVRFIIAGGTRALTEAVEAVEDNRALGERDLARLRPTKKDVVIGIAASGNTRYTVAAVEYARRVGARTVGLVCVPKSKLARAAEIEILVNTGEEALRGSTRMKAGTAQKMVLNMLTTGAMARLGRIYGDLMANVQIRNHKLAERSRAILEEAAGVDASTALHALRAAKNELPVALIMLKTGLSRTQARQRLKSTKGNVRAAIGKA